MATNSFPPNDDDAERALEPGTRLGRYQLVRLLGHGGMGAVYEAIHVDLKKRVALKTLLRKHASNKDSRARFLREGEAASRIRHPNVVDVTDVGLDKGIPFLVMEYLTGQSLHDLLTKRGSLPLVEAVSLMLPVLSAVAEGHRRGVFHRDLKPHNIFVGQTRAGEVLPKVLDFGISKLKDEGKPNTFTEANSFLGTVTYMSPEQARAARSVDGRSDEYSLAVVLYQCVTGRTPHVGENTIELIYKIASGEFDPPRKHRPDLPQEFESVLMRALCTSPDARYESVRLFASALLPFASQEARALWEREFTERERPLTPAPPAPDSTLAALATLTTLNGATTLSGSASEVDGPPLFPTGRRFPRLPIALAGAAILTAALAFFISSKLSSRTPSRPEVIASTVSPRPANGEKNVRTFSIKASAPHALIELDGVAVGTGVAKQAVPVSEQPHHLKITALGFHPYETMFTADALPPAFVELERVAAAAPAGAARKAQSVAKATGPIKGKSGKPKRGTNNALILE